MRSRKQQDIGSGVEISYLDEGEGEPLFFIHGFTGTALADHATLMDELRPTHRLIAPDMRGYGASRPPNRDFPADFYQRDAADMAALLDSLNCGPVTVLGFSDGAEVSLLLAANRPDLVRGVVAWGVCGVISSEEVESIKSWLPLSEWDEARPEWKSEIIERHGEEQFESMVTGWIRAAHQIHERGGDISYGVANRIQCPVLIMNGDGEVGNTPRDVRRLAERIPYCRLEFIADSGHPIHKDQPEIFMAKVKDFINNLANL